MVKTPECKKCGQSIYLHRLVGYMAYCDPDERNPETRSPFKAKEVNRVQRMLGHPVSHHARAVELRDND